MRRAVGVSSFVDRERVERAQGERSRGNRVECACVVPDSFAEVLAGTKAADVRRECVRLDEMPVLPRRSLKRRVRVGVAAGLERAGVAGLFRRATGTAGATILMYHSVAEADAAAWIDPRNHVTPARFAAQMRRLARTRRVIPLAALVEALRRGTPTADEAVVLTFDDGYLDNLTIAAPILAEHNLPATLYLPTAYITRGAPQWIDALYGTLRARTRDELRLAGASSRSTPALARSTMDAVKVQVRAAGQDGAPEARTYDLRDVQQRVAAYFAAAAELLPATAAARAERLDDIREQLAPAAEPPRLTMTWDDVRTLRRQYSNFTIGVHTCEHLDLSTMPPETARAELEASRADVERELGERPVDFSFPYSRSTAQTRRLVAELGFRSAMAFGDARRVVRGTDVFGMSRGSG